ncbi:hypothetical protein HHK36_012322 [Tetracentron sinense]|uniref:3'-5' exonuclease domain-containing protein n=1 Tax=Tetracentron sinense TaxID=13715 RepID=A0A834Z5L6_TETSI|nr:hypothetical protein HHK36_012322 [Tetracentron sinense]
MASEEANTEVSDAHTSNNQAIAAGRPPNTQGTSHTGLGRALAQRALTRSNRRRGGDRKAGNNDSQSLQSLPIGIRASPQENIMVTNINDMPRKNCKWCTDLSVPSWIGKRNIVGASRPPQPNPFIARPTAGVVNAVAAAPGSSGEGAEISTTQHQELVERVGKEKGCKGKDSARSKGPLGGNVKGSKRMCQVGPMGRGESSRQLISSRLPPLHASFPANPSRNTVGASRPPQPNPFITCPIAGVVNAVVAAPGSSGEGVEINTTQQQELVEVCTRQQLATGTSRIHQLAPPATPGSTEIDPLGLDPWGIPYNLDMICSYKQLWGQRAAQRAGKEKSYKRKDIAKSKGPLDGSVKGSKRMCQCFTSFGDEFDVAVFNVVDDVTFFPFLFFLLKVLHVSLLYAGGLLKIDPMLLLVSSMGLEERVGQTHKNKGKAHQTRTICLHAFSDLSRILPAIFVYLLKECYVCGLHKATMKFRVLQQQVHQVLHNAPQPGPATFVVQCLYVLPLLGSPDTEGFSHLVLSALNRLQTVWTNPADLSEAKDLATQLFLDVVAGFIIHEERIVIKLLETFDVRLNNIEKTICDLEVNDSGLDAAKACIERYVFGLIESQSYITAVTLLERFSIRQLGQPFLIRMMQDSHFKAAEKWATFMGKPMLCLLVQKYIDMKMLKNAYEIIKRNNLRQEFPDVYHMCKESSLKKLAEKGCWDIAEARTNNDRQLVEYLVYLAMEAGYSEKVDELCERYSLRGFVEATEPEANPLHTRYLHLNDLVLEDIIWVDEINSLRSATSHIEECKVVGIDCEWKPNYVKGSKPNKVSILQVASEKTAFIFDLIKLFEDVPDVLDNCLKQILHSPSILKLGYNLQCDINQLAHSYGDLECFKHYEMLLDIQNVFKEPRGGLSGLAEKILGAGLNKTRRNSNWEQRPLSQNQLEYAALDAAVLVHLFHHIRSQSQPTSVKEGRAKLEWKSYIVSHMDDAKKSKNTSKSKKGAKAGSKMSSKSN